jgi:hypothetical protein
MRGLHLAPGKVDAKNVDLSICCRLYFVVGDEIIIVDRNHKIVAVLAV